MRILSGIQPTGDTHLGNLIGALRHYVTNQDLGEAFYFVADLHALTLLPDPAEVRDYTLRTAAMLLATGVDPDRATLFVQSHVHEHTELCWLLECTAAMGELERMTQFKDKAAKGGVESARVGLFTYPVLQAADILLYDADRVPVGEDQRQHLELCRDLAIRFNHRHGETFVVPEAGIPKVGAKIYDLQEPTKKMSKSNETPGGMVLVLDDPKAIEKKIKRAVTDSATEVVYDPENRPGVSNLLTLLGVATGGDPAALAADYSQYGPLKADTAAAVVEFLRPVRERYAELAADPGEVTRILRVGADKATEVASKTLRRAKDAMGFLPRG
jgi:tryptophanyl-tRNA synthetase